MLKKTQFLMIGITLSMLAIPVPAAANDNPCRKNDSGKIRGRTHEIDLAAIEGDGDTVKGPVCLVVQNVNRLRYDVSISRKVTLTDGPDVLSLPFAFPFPPKAKEATPSAAEVAGAAEALAVDPQADGRILIDDAITGLESRAGELAAKINSARAMAQGAAQALAGQKQDLDRLVAGSDAVLRTAGAAGAHGLAKRIETRQRHLATALAAANWPASETVKGLAARLAKLRKDVANLPRVEIGFADWYLVRTNAERFQALETRLEAMVKILDSLGAESPQRKDFTTLRQSLGDWDLILASLTSASAFEERIPAACGFPFFKNKELAYKVARRDRLSDKKEVKEQSLVTVACPSHLTISTGVGITGLEERDYAFVPSVDGDKVVSRFGLENRSDQTLGLVALLNTRFKTWGSYGLHVSAGPAFDFDSGASGTQVGYLFGVSLSVKDDFFFTGGFQYGRVSTLAGGFTEGGVVPEGITEPPLQREWKTDWAFSVTYKIR